MARMNYNRPIHRINDDNRSNKPVYKSRPSDTSKKVKTSYKKKKATVYAARINFGKYKGMMITQLPSEYLEYLISITPDNIIALEYARVLANRKSYKGLNK